MVLWSDETSTVALSHVGEHRRLLLLQEILERLAGITQRYSLRDTEELPVWS